MQSAANFLPSVIIKDRPIYELLSSTHWTLLVCGKEKIKFQHKQLKILHLPENTYPDRYILVRSDRHMVFSGNILNEPMLLSLIK